MNGILPNGLNPVNSLNGHQKPPEIIQIDESSQMNNMRNGFRGIMPVNKKPNEILNGGMPNSGMQNGGINGGLNA